MRELLASVNYNQWVLPALLVIPLLGAGAIYLFCPPAHPDEREYGEGTRPRQIALWTLLIEFVVSMGLWWSFDPGSPEWQAYVDLPWLPDWGARFTLGVDGISLFMVLLTTFIMPLAIMGDWTSVRRKLRTHYALFLLLTTGMIGVFSALDMLLFYVMWELMLVPMYFIIGMWGGERRLYASIKFFLYTTFGSLLMLVALIALWRNTGATSFSYDIILANAGNSPPVEAMWMFGAFFLAFAIKVPLFPFHTWLPDAHVEAPTGGSVVLASVMLKMGTYGFMRFGLPFFPEAAMHPTVRGIILGLAIVGIVYGALVALVQPDIKKLVAYSSVSHMGFVLLGIFALTVQSVQGALMVMISHGISTGGLFLLIGMLYERTHTRQIAAYGGLARAVPMYAAVLTLVALSSIGLPGTNGFVGEFLVLIGSYRTVPVATAIAATGVVFAAAYLLWAIQRIIFNPMTHLENADLADLNKRELTVMVVMSAVIIWMGVHPAPVLRRMEPASQRFVLFMEKGAGLTPSAPPAPVGGR
jgi:NADH-quinone oxidoreductase subunit M